MDFFTESQSDHINWNFDFDFDFDFQGREQANKILKETRVEMRKIAKQFPKRSIIGEINNLLKFPKKDVESFFDTKRKPTDVFVDTKKKTTDVFVDNNDTARYESNLIIGLL